MPDLKNETLEVVRLFKEYLSRQIETGESSVWNSGSLPKPQTAPSETPVENPLNTFRKEIRDCRKCPLHATRKNFVFGSGDPSAKLVVVGEAPGEEEDLQGLPFVGTAGKLLTKILAAVNFNRDEVYIANVLKCRPPKNRMPAAEEIEQCRAHLFRQIEIISPRIICAMGRFAAQTLLDSSEPIGRLRGRIHYWRKIPVIPTYHPSACLHDPAYKKYVWNDVRLLRREFDRLTG